MSGVGKRQRLVLLSYFLNVSQLLRSSIHSKGFRDAFSPLAFSLTGSPPSCGSYHLYSSVVKKGHSAHTVYGRRTWGFISSSCLNQRHHIPYSSMPVTSTSQSHSLTNRGPTPLSWLRTILCFASVFGFCPLLSCWVLLMHMHTLSPHVYHML